MKGALPQKPAHRFDAEGKLVKDTEDESDEITFLRESVVLYTEGMSPNHPADVAASNAPEEPVPEEAVNVPGPRTYTPPVEEPESTEEDDSSSHSSRRRRGR